MTNDVQYIMFCFYNIIFMFEIDGIKSDAVELQVEK